MLEIEFTGQFKKDYRQAIKRGCDPEKLREVVGMLAAEITLPEKYRDHQLLNTRNYRDMRECHIEPDWLLIYRVCRERIVLTLIRTGMYSDLF